MRKDPKGAALRLPQGGTAPLTRDCYRISCDGENIDVGSENGVFRGKVLCPAFFQERGWGEGAKPPEKTASI